MVWRELTNAFAGPATNAFFDKLTNHGHKLRMVARRPGAGHADSLRITEPPCFIVKVVEYFHVVREKPDWRNHDTVNA